MTCHCDIDTRCPLHGARGKVPIHVALQTLIAEMREAMQPHAGSVPRPPHVPMAVSTHKVVKWAETLTSLIEEERP